jgi:hypothetical protein
MSSTDGVPAGDEELEIIELETEVADQDGNTAVDDLIIAVDGDGNIIAADETVTVVTAAGDVVIDETISVAGADGELHVIEEDVEVLEAEGEA